MLFHPSRRLATSRGSRQEARRPEHTGSCYSQTPHRKTRPAAPPRRARSCAQRMRSCVSRMRSFQRWEVIGSAECGDSQRIPLWARRRAGTRRAGAGAGSFAERTFTRPPRSTFQIASVPRHCCAAALRNPYAPTSALSTRIGAGKLLTPAPAHSLTHYLPSDERGRHRRPRSLAQTLYLGRRVIRSVSLPSEETTLNFSVTLTTPVQPDELHERLPPAVTVGVPVWSSTTTMTDEPSHTPMR